MYALRTSTTLSSRRQFRARIDGQRLGRHLRAAADNDGLLAMVLHPGDFAQNLKEFAVFAEGIQNCSWKSRRPCARSLHVDVEIVLSPAESSR